MLSEIYTLHKSLERCGISPEKVHPWVTYHKKNDGFIVGIDESGQVQRITFHPKEKMVITWKLMPDNQKSFPVVNLKVPVWMPKQDTEELRALLKEKRGENRFNQLQEICNDADLFPHDKNSDLGKYLSVLSKKLCNFPKELQEIMHNSIDERSPFFNLINRIQKTSENTGLFLHQLSDAVITACINGQIESPETAEQLLLGKWNKKKRNYDSADIPIVFDVDNYSDFEYRIFAQETKQLVNKALSRKKKKPALQEKCALSGIPGELEKKKFPEPKLPILGKSYLFSMNKDAPCHYRYGHISAANYPVNIELANDLQDCLLYITAPERKGKTWRAVPGSDKKESNLLVSYLENMPINDIDFSFLSDGGDKEADFEVTAKLVCDALKGKEVSPDDQLRIFVLKSVDTGRRQVLFNSAFSVSTIFNGLEIWRKGSKNHPAFSLVIPLKKGQKAAPFAPFCPSPSSIMFLFHYQWIRNGLGNTAVQGCRLDDVYDLFFSTGNSNRKLCIKFLRTLLRQTSSLLLGIGEALHTKTVKKYSVEAKRHTLLTVGLIGLLLYKLNHERENYMKQDAFQIGRILSLADTVHKEYGRVVRKKDIPAQLIGNAMMKIALDNPQRALARLPQRLLVYKAWADKGGEDVGLARWALGEIGKISLELENSDLSFRPDEAAQAKMLLGYLARNTKNETTSGGTDNGKQ